VEIRPDSGVYDYTSRYTAGATRFLCPAELAPAVAERCAEMALRVHDVLGLRDLSRTDLVVDADGEPVFLEVNVSPGMTETSLVPLAIEAAGWSLGKMCADLVRVAAARAEVAATAL
jgi:D-alanine-D-alanine ligase